MHASDTAPEIAALQLAIYARMSPERKLAVVEDANRTARLLTLSGLRKRHPEADEDEIRLRLFHLVLGEELATKAYGSLPDD